jgi:hypothetical protein
MALNYFFTVVFLALSLAALFFSRAMFTFFLNIANDSGLSKRVGLALAIPGLALLIFILNTENWYFRVWSIVSFLFGLGFFLRGLFFIFFRNFLVSALEKMIDKRKLISVFAFLIMLCFSLLTLIRDYVGPIEDISNCSNGSKLEVYCVLSNPEDISKTPDEKYLIVSEFGGIKPYEEPKEGSLALFNLSTKMREDLYIKLGSNVWGDPKCQREDLRFGPHGIDLNKRYDGSYQLAVVNHYPEESVEFFELVFEGNWSLVWRGCVSVPEKYYINDIALERSGSFFTTHMYPRNTSINQLLSAATFKYSTGMVLFWNKFKFEELSFTNSGQPNGIAKKDNILYVANNLSDTVKAYDLIKEEEIFSFSVNGPDNLIIDNNSIWVTSLNHETFDVIAKCDGYTLEGIEEDHMVCSLPFKVIELSTKDLTPINIFTFNKNKAAFPTVAMPDGNSVWIGSFSLDRLVSFEN